MNDLFIPLHESKQIQSIIEKSYEKPVAIFKHSTRCGISRMVFQRLTNSLTKNQFDIHLYYLDLLNYRTLSNSIAEEFKIIHESPQLLVIKDGNVLDSASHYSILEMDLKKICE